MKVTVYGSPTCGVCTAVKGYLQHRKVRFREYNVSLDPEARQEMINLTGGSKTLPVVVVGTEAVIGFDRDRLDELLT